MSYFLGNVTGQSAANLDNLTILYAQTPAVHDVYTVQQVYGADMTTRAGDTVYGFNSTADKGVFDFTQDTHPVLTIWDGGGNDTLDLSGFNSNSIIDLNEGAFSSASNKVTDAVKAQDMAALGITTEAKWQTSGQVCAQFGWIAARQHFDRLWRADRECDRRRRQRHDQGQ